MKFVHGILALLFVVFGYVQLNDPDAWLWAGIYWVIAILMLLGIRGIYIQPLLLAGIGACVIGLIVIGPATYNSIVNYDPNLAPDPSVTHTHDIQTEKMKEFGGLFITLLGLLFLYVQARKQMKPWNRGQ